MQSRTDANRVAEILTVAYPDAKTALNGDNPFHILTATILSAQCTDSRVNETTPALFAAYPDAPAMADAAIERLEELIRPVGFHRSKAKNLKGMAQSLVKIHGGVVPRDLASLTALPGVGRKTANVVLANAYEIASGFVVDTHVKRLAYRLGLSVSANAEIIERDLKAAFPRSQWIETSRRLILHGRAVCRSRRPRCELCPLIELCPRNGLAVNHRHAHSGHS